jgi:hypothetical protein
MPFRDTSRHSPDVRNCPVAVELHLEAPVVAVRNALFECGEHRPIGTRRMVCAVVASANQQPVLLLAVEVSRHERPAALQAPSVQHERPLTVPLAFHEVVGAGVPHLDRAGAVLALWNLTLESRVLERVILDVHRECAVPGLERHAFRHRPRGEGAVLLEPQVVVEVPGVVPLDDEDRVAGPPAPAGKRLRRLGGVALTPILAEGHLGSLGLRPGRPGRYPP